MITGQWCSWAIARPGAERCFVSERKMLETARENVYSLSQDVRDRFASGEPDGRNPGIGPVESACALAAAIATTLATRHLLEAGWRQTFDRDPPMNPASHEVHWKEALLWGAVSGAVIGVARVASRRASSSAYRNIRG